MSAAKITGPQVRLILDARPLPGTDGPLYLRLSGSSAHRCARNLAALTPPLAIEQPNDSFVLTRAGEALRERVIAKRERERLHREAHTLRGLQARAAEIVRENEALDSEASTKRGAA